MFKSTAGHPGALINYLTGLDISKREAIFLNFQLARLDKMIVNKNIDEKFIELLHFNMPDQMMVQSNLKHSDIGDRGYLHTFIYDCMYDIDEFIYLRKKEYGLL